MWTSTITKLLFTLVFGCFCRDLPSYFPRCSLRNPNLNNCLLNAANSLKPYLKEGVKEIGLPSFYPLIASTFWMKQESQLVNYTITLWNFAFWGLDNFNLKEIRYDPKTLTFQGHIEFDSILMKGPYEMHGRLLSVPIEGNGDGQAFFTSIEGRFEITGELKKRRRVKYYNPTETKVSLKVGDGNYYFGGLFEGNENLAGYTNDFVNRNSEVITHAITPVHEELARSGLMRLMQLLTRSVPYHKLFPRSH